jgi:protein-S-isoprenylcysteine O-methyltransferase Ste14
MHKVHTHAHEQSKEIERLVTNGIYSRMRHPGYSSLILMYVGFALAWGKVIILIPVALFIILTLLTAIREEVTLREKFKEEYEDYAKRVPWRFIPGII